MLAHIALMEGEPTVQANRAALMTGCWRARLRKSWRAATSSFTTHVPRELHDQLIQLQFRRLREGLPMMCLLMAANWLAMTVAVLGDLPAWQQYAPPAILIGVCLFTLVFGPKAEDEARAELLLRRTTIATALGGLVAGLWGVNAFTETERYYCMVAPVFIGIGAMVGASCLLATPRAALAGMVTTIAPIVIKMIMFDNTGVRAMAVMLVLAGLMQGRIVLEKFRETVSMLTYQTELDRLAWTDSLTGLDNRRAFTNQLEAALDQGAPVILAIADLDGMKAANDRHGHLAGDEVLMEVARRMRRFAVTASSVARLGGDEFALLYLGVGDGAHDQAQAELAAIRRAVPMPVLWGNKLLTIGTSMGIAVSPVDGTDPSALLACADERLYADKAANRAATGTDGLGGNSERHDHSAPRRAAV